MALPEKNSDLRVDGHAERPSTRRPAPRPVTSTNSLRPREPIPERITWAVDQLKPAPQDRILEVGCAGGHALALIAARAPACTLIGIDRSAIQVTNARGRLGELPSA